MFRPLFTVMSDRSATIDKSLQEAKEIEARLEKTKTEQKEMIKEAKSEATAILEEANRQADERKNGLLAKAKEEIGEVINREKAKMQADKAETLRSIRVEMAELISLGLEKVLQEKLDKGSDEKIISKVVKQLD